MAWKITHNGRTVGRAKTRAGAARSLATCRRKHVMGGCQVITSTGYVDSSLAGYSKSNRKSRRVRRAGKRS